LQARALWLIGLIGGKERKEIDEALRHSDPRFRILGLRVGRTAGRDIAPLVRPLLADSDPKVRRECALALQHVEGEAAVEPLLALARGYDGKDRWYLEAWAIGARGKEAALATALTAELGWAGFDPKLADFLWELHAPGALPYLTKAVENGDLPVEQRLSALRAIGDRAEPQATRAVAGLVASGEPRLAEAAFDKLGRQLFSQWTDRRADPAVVSAVRRAFSDEKLRSAAIQLADDFGDPAYSANLMAIARDELASEAVRARAITAVGRAGEARYLPTLQQIAQGDGALALRIAAMRGLAYARQNDLDALME
jgi:HEAT repeat protein